ncbi:UNVERIFIED_CONTAM: hypothetical protein HDU68_010769 [Siphonaria sp. JEL0065]|nr:hypothetical protein HDU68_010769 [Siphonaria sp. JEL0065]
MPLQPPASPSQPRTQSSPSATNTSIGSATTTTTMSTTNHPPSLRLPQTAQQQQQVPTLSLIPPKRLDLSAITTTKINHNHRNVDSPIGGLTSGNSLTSASQKPGASLPSTIMQTLNPSTLPAWIDALVRDGTASPNGVTSRFEKTFRIIEEVEGYRLRASHSTSSSTDAVGIGYSGIGEKYVGPRVCSKEAFGPGAWGRNRYSDIFPFDEWRVVLKHGGSRVVAKKSGASTLQKSNLGPTGGGGGVIYSDYINASYLDTRMVGVLDAGDRAYLNRFQDGVGNEGVLEGVGVYGKRYIGAQGPLGGTVGDFWAMVWDQNVCVVVMLTREEEKGRLKCTRYWPDNGIGSAIGSANSYLSNSSSSGGVCTKFQWSHGRDAELEVVFVDQKVLKAGDIIVRQFEIIRTLTPKEFGNLGESQVRTVHQVQFLGWPDHKSSDPAVVLDVIDVANTLQQEAGPEAGPMVVHCSAGCGRTGTFCTIDSVLYQLENGDGSPETPIASTAHLGASDESNLSNMAPPSSSSPSSTTSTPVTPSPRKPPLSLAVNPSTPIVSSPLQIKPSAPSFRATLEEDLIFQCVMTLRSQRVSMVQTLDQYAFCYDAVVARMAQWERAGRKPKWKPVVNPAPRSPFVPEAVARPTGGWKLKSALNEDGNITSLLSPAALMPAMVPPTPAGITGGVFDWDAALLANK